MSDLELITLNVNGIRGATKRRAIFKSIRKRKADIVFLQETHSTVQEERLWSAEWGGRMLFAHGLSNARGVAILLARNSQVEIVNHMGDADGRLLVAHVQTGETTLTLLNAYAPTADRPEEQILFLDNLERHLQNASSPSLIVGGDFNFCINPIRDRSSREGTQCSPALGDHVNPRVRQKFNALMEEFQVLDAWRFLNTTTEQFTFRRRAYASRLDFWLISEHLSEWAHKSEIIPVALSDHSAVSLLLKLVPMGRGPGNWRFDNDLLGKEEFVSAMGEFLEEYQPPDMSSPHVRWDFLKYEIRRLVMTFQKKIRSKNGVRRRNLERTLREMESSDLTHDPDKEETYLSCKRELAELELAEANKTILRARANWAQLGERPNKYFLNLQKRKVRNQTMSQVFDEDGVLTSDPKRILEITSSFFEKLYCGDPEIRPLEEMDWEKLTIPKIKDATKEGMEEPYSEAELLGALKKMNLGKCPGSDGLTVEFYLKFWELLKGPFMESLHHGLSIGELSTEQKRGIINLIPKKDSDRRKVSNWRPISLLNIDYKILTKAMSMRLQPALREIIHPDQTGFLPGRFIGENLRTIQDVIDCVNSRSESALLIALDFRKAFDNVRWEFVYRAFREFGFGQNFIDGLKTIFSNIEDSG